MSESSSTVSRCGARRADLTGAGRAALRFGASFQEAACLRQLPGAQLDAQAEDIFGRPCVAQRLGLGTQRLGLGRLADVELVFGQQLQEPGARLPIGDALCQSQRLLQQALGLGRADGIQVDRGLPVQRAAYPGRVPTGAPDAFSLRVPGERLVEAAAQAADIAQEGLQPRMLGQDGGWQRIQPTDNCLQSP